MILFPYSHKRLETHRKIFKKILTKYLNALCVSFFSALTSFFSSLCDYLLCGCLTE
jgi:hypothetical protein